MSTQGMMNHPSYYYDQPFGPIYVPDPWRTTTIPHHFPEHHYPLEKTRHAVGSVFSALGHTLLHPYELDVPVHNPRADIQESEANYYIDVELPGIGGKDHVKLKWLGQRTLLVTAIIRRPLNDEDKHAKEANNLPQDTASIQKMESNGEKEGLKKHETTENISNGGDRRAKDDRGSVSNEQKVFVTLGERIIGSFARAFNFATDVDHKQVKVQVEHGLLRIKVPKSFDGVVSEHESPKVSESSKHEA